MLFLRRRNCYGADGTEWANRGCFGQISEVLPALCQKEMHDELIPRSQTGSHQPLQYAIHLINILVFPKFCREGCGSIINGREKSVARPLRLVL